MKHQRSSLWFGLFIAVVIIMSCSTPESMDSDQLFVKIPSSSSGISFINRITENVGTRENLLDFDYFYNGAGVGVADLNNDGYKDIFFAANQGENKLFANQGDFKFEDLTEGSGLNRGKYWSNGVTFVDINEDGWLDIYVSQGGPHEQGMRKNTLFVNQKDMTFLESADSYGLADKGISTQSAFFDFDKDGDLDCFVMNESELYGYDPIAFHRAHLENPGRFDVSFSHLYRNDGGKFQDVSIEVGIDKPTFGLGLVISDINNDNWLDIYVANDYYLPDNLYINRGDGTFSDRSKVHLKQMSFFGMGADIADVDGDGYQDICVLDMASKDHYRSKTLMASMDLESFDLLVNGLGFSHQYMFNTLQINDGNGRFNNVAHMTGLSKTDWSWAALIDDLDLDADSEIFVSNGYRRYALDNDFKRKVTATKNQYDGEVPLDVKRKLYSEMPSEPLPNVVYDNLGNLQFAESGKLWGLTDETFSNGAALADLDNDGDLDLVLNNIDQEALLYRNNAVERGRNNFLVVRMNDSNSEHFTKVEIVTAGQRMVKEIKRVRGYMSALPAEAHFGLGTIDRVDELIATLTDGSQIVMKDLAANQIINVDTNQPTIAQETVAMSKNRTFEPVSPLALGIEYQHRENEYNDFEKEVLLPQKQSTIGPKLAKGDLNGDGLDDLILPGAAGMPTEIYLQNSGRFQKVQCSVCEKDANAETIHALALDVDSDGDEDLLMVNGGNEWPEGQSDYGDVLYENDGSANFTPMNNRLDYDKNYSGSFAIKVDYDLDGDEDVLLGNRIVPQQYPRSAPSFLLENQEGVLRDVTEKVMPDLAKSGILNDAVFTDINRDGRLDVLTVGEWDRPGVFIYDNGQFKNQAEKYLPETLSGWWYSIHLADLDGDGSEDYLLGNMGLNMKHSASIESPFKVFASDFDDNGSFDIVLSSQYKNEYVPARGRECSSQQMPFILDEFPSYDRFASATLVDIYGDDKLSSAYQKEVTEFRSVVLVNDGTEPFHIITLPAKSQAFPLLDAIVHDFNDDGRDDVLIAGCIYNTEVETPRMDAGTGMVLSSDRDGIVHDQSEAYQLFIPGNVKSLLSIEMQSGENFIFAGKNNSGISIFRLHNTNESIVQ